MNQDEVFLRSEGDAWFSRNRDQLERADRVDWPARLIEELAQHGAIRRVIELGCASGWRLK